MTRPTIAITMGDPAGIGPEVIMKALALPGTQALCHALVIGDANRLRTAGRIVGVPLKVDALTDAKDADFSSKAVQCLDLKLVPDDLPFGKMSAAAGEAAYRYIEKAVQVVQAGLAQAICTAPLSKEALHAAGHKYPGHTELLAHLTGTPEVSMMLASPKLRVIHVTTHIGLSDAIAKIEPGLVERVIARGHEVLVRAGIANPRIGVCAHQSACRRERAVRSRRGSHEDHAGRRSLPGLRAGTCADRCPPTRCSSWPAAATTTWWSRCITIRAMDRSRCWGWKPA